MRLIDINKEPDDWPEVTEAGGEVSLQGDLLGPNVLVSKYVDNCLETLVGTVIDTVAHKGTLNVRDREGRSFVLTVENADTVTWHILEVDL